MAELEHVGGDQVSLELRVPWAYLGFADPSSLRLLQPRRDGSMSTVRATRVGIAVTAGPQRRATRGFAWLPWNRVTWHERRKAGWEILGHAFESAS